MEKELKNGQGFNCKDLKERTRIWKKLEDAGYPMFHSFEIQDYSYLDYPHIVYHNDYFCFCKNAVSMPLNEAEFFGEDEITPENKEMTHGQKLEYMNLAGGIVGFRFSDKDLDMLVSTYELILEKQGRTDISDLCKVKADVNDRHKTIEP